MWQSATALLVAIALITPVGAAAQQPAAADTLRRGAHVRVLRGPPEAPRVELEGALDRISGDTVTLRVTGDRFESRVLGDDQSLQVRTSRQRRTWRGLAIGATVGAIAGLVIVGATYQECADCIYDPGAGSTALGGAVLFGLLGGGVGALIGAQSGPQTWAPVPRQPGMRVGFTPPTPLGPARLALSLSF